VECDESKSCGSGRVCCEIMWGSGQNEPIICTTPRPGEYHPCDYVEPCVPGVACVTPGAQCVHGRCTVPRPPRALQCGTATCTASDSVCCFRNEKQQLECASAEKCDAPDFRFGCTSPANCPRGDFCGVMVAGGGCMHSNDGDTQIICETAKDCPHSIRNSCKSMKQRLACAPTDIDAPILRGRKTCQCLD
jgi:hypothetical protein